MDSIYDDSIIIIGGMGIGKTTISQLLSKQINMNVISIDEKKHDVLLGIPDYSFDKQLKIRKEKGYVGEMEYLIPYTNIAINKTIDSLTEPCIIDMGAFFRGQLNDEIIQKLKQFRRVIYLCSDDNMRVLDRRNIDPKSELGHIYLETLNNGIYESICTSKIKVDNKTIDEIVNEIIVDSKSMHK